MHVNPSKAPHDIRRLINGVMSVGSATDRGSVDSMVSFFWKSAENLVLFSQGTFLRSNGGIVNTSAEAVSTLDEVTIITDCGMIDDLAFDFHDRSMYITHCDVPCFIEKPHTEIKTRATRVYFNPVDKVFVAVDVDYQGDGKVGPFSSKAFSKFFRIIPLRSDSPENIFETMVSLLCGEETPPEYLERIYRPVH